MEENRIDRAKRFSKIWWQSRADAGVSQEYMALGLGISKKTVQNWEKGTSSPSFFQGLEWFNLLGINPMPYFYEFIYPGALGQSNMGRSIDTNDEQVSKFLALLIEEMPMEERRALLYLLYGNHGSSPYAVLQMLLAHLQSPMKDRVSHAASIVQDYEIAKELGNITRPDNIQPRIDFLKSAVAHGRNAAVKNHFGYSMNPDERL